jgi:hypothetical protein
VYLAAEAEEDVLCEGIAVQRRGQGGGSAGEVHSELHGGDLDAFVRQAEGPDFDELITGGLGRLSLRTVQGQRADVHRVAAADNEYAGSDGYVE